MDFQDKDTLTWKHIFYEGFIKKEYDNETIKQQ